MIMGIGVVMLVSQYRAQSGRGSPADRNTRSMPVVLVTVPVSHVGPPIAQANGRPVCGKVALLGMDIPLYI
jgi:hypothetical protein